MCVTCMKQEESKFRDHVFCRRMKERNLGSYSILYSLQRDKAEKNTYIYEKHL